jgi:hypothetical protein
MWDGIRFEIDPTVSAVSTLIVVFTSTLVLFAGYVSRRLSQKRKMDGIDNRQLGTEVVRMALHIKSEADFK